MHFHISNKLIVTAVMFVVSFIAVTFIFVKKPHLAKSRNKAVKAAAIFCIAFVPGVLAATVCAKTITEVCSRVWGEPQNEIVMSEEEDDEEEEDKSSVA